MIERAASSCASDGTTAGAADDEVDASAAALVSSVTAGSPTGLAGRKVGAEEVEGVEGADGDGIEPVAFSDSRASTRACAGSLDSVAIFSCARRAASSARIASACDFLTSRPSTSVRGVDGALESGV